MAASQVFNQHNPVVITESPPQEQGAVDLAVRAAAAGNVEKLQLLLRPPFGVRILHWPHLQTGVTPLSAAAFGGHILAVNFLLSNGARPGDPNRFGWTPIMSAALGGRGDVLLQLIGHGARAGGPNLDQQDADGCTALWWACCLGHAEAAQLLINSGARWDLASDWGVSPLEVAVRAGRRQCMRLFQVCQGGVGGRGALGDPDHPVWCPCAGGVAGLGR
jgi:uncharacterized protein